MQPAESLSSFWPKVYAGESTVGSFVSFHSGDSVHERFCPYIALGKIKGLGGHFSEGFWQRFVCKFVFDYRREVLVRSYRAKSVLHYRSHALEYVELWLLHLANTSNE